MERIGTQLTAAVVIQDDGIPSATSFSNLEAGGMFHKETKADMLAIPEYYRYDKYISGEVKPLWGLKCHVHSDTTVEYNGEWELIKGLSSNDIMDNANWRKTQQGSISADDVTETPTRVFITPAERELIKNDKGHHETEAALNVAYPVGESGWYAVVEFTNTFWVWSVGSSAWVNSGNAATLYVHPNHTGEVTSNADGAQTITAKAVTNAKLADMAANTLKGVIVSGQPQDLTPTQVRTILGIAENANNYTHPNHTGDVTSNGDGQTTISNGVITFLKLASALIAASGEESATKLVRADDERLNAILEIANDSITNAKLANMPANTIKGAIVAGDPIDLTATQLRTLLNIQENATDDQTATEIRDLLVTLLGTERLPASAIKDLPTVAPTVIVDNLNSTSTTSALSANQGYVINQNLATKQAAIDSLIQLVASDDFNLDTIQEIVDFIEQNRTDLTTYISDLQGKLDSITSSDGSVTIDLTNPNEPDLSVLIPEGLELATEAENIAATINTKASSPLGVLQNLAQRAGVGLTYNQTTKKLNIGGTTNGDINLDFGSFNRFRLSGDNMSGGGYRYLNWNYNGLDIDGAGKYKLAINESEFSMNFAQGTSSIYANETVMFMVVGDSQWIVESSSGGIKGQIKTTDIETRDDDSVAIKTYVDKTQIGTAITASKTFSLTDAGAKKITAVNSASAVVLTIPADATLDFPIGSTINIRRKGSGSVEIVGAVGVTIEGIADSNGDFKIPQYGIASMYKESANLWVIYGALES